MDYEMLKNIEIEKSHIKAISNHDNSHNLYPHLINVDFSSMPIIWFKNSPIMTFYENSLSISLPIAERFMVETVKEAKAFIRFDEHLSEEDVDTFCEQENNHADMHQKLNDHLAKMGYDVSSLTENVKKLFDKYRTFTLSERLQITAMIETTGAVLGVYIIKHWEGFEIDENLKKLFIWHGLEEIEHRNIGFNVCKYYHNGKAIYSKSLIIKFGLLLNLIFTKSIINNLWSLKYFFRLKNISECFVYFINKGYLPYFLRRGAINFFKNNYDPQVEFDMEDINNYVLMWEKKYHLKSEKY